MTLLSLLLACDAWEKPEGGEPDAGTQDPFVEALGGCTGEVEAFVDDVLDRVVVSTYDDNGDRTYQESTDADDQDDDWVREMWYGAPHELIEEHFRYPNARTSDSDIRFTFTWAAGQIVTQEEDYGADGTVEVRGTMSWEDGILTRWEWDLDGDGTIDDYADYAWVADRDGWAVTSLGEDPNGPYSTVEWRDAELRIAEYHYVDATGYEVQWDYSGFSVLGGADDSWRKEWEDGSLILEETRVVEFDALGRFSSYETTGETWASPGSSEVHVEELLYSYDCP